MPVCRAKRITKPLVNVFRYPAREAPHSQMGLTPVASRIMTLKETLKQLKALGNAKVRAQNAKSGAGDNQSGVSLGDIRVLAKKIRTDHLLALSLWETGNVDAQFLATFLIQPKKLSADEMERMVRSVTFVRVADWLNAYVVRQHPDKETLRQEWMLTDDHWAARAGWDLTAERVAKSPDGLALLALLDRIESEMASANREVQWTMNNTLAAIGIHFSNTASLPTSALRTAPKNPRV